MTKHTNHDITLFFFKYTHTTEGLIWACLHSSILFFAWNETTGYRILVFKHQSCGMHAWEPKHSSCTAKTQTNTTACAQACFSKISSCITKSHDSSRITRASSQHTCMRSRLLSHSWQTSSRIEKLAHVLQIHTIAYILQSILLYALSISPHNCMRSSLLSRSWQTSSCITKSHANTTKIAHVNTPACAQACFREVEFLLPFSSKVNFV